ncbi:MAG: zinc ABC transporter substrate-binding protein [Sulfurimicrobium sp.]|nr:zinc ABC transporter substrate-binding protein [Sulfurimicrobium sp.]MDO9189071.1 zinc ABC transporter substrate-binding protein [Sulfurimicrobium sp.]MDP1897466.1 zinc ABC transporter substrate-binding protein [Sulfurimicrobium sp.]MDP2197648.1 zinc ABC transporter substrate-binding protein [Sulfurimicrobium sp.]
MQRLLKLLLIAVLGAFPLPALAALNILACEPEWGALANELGGNKVTVYNATTALQDPHRIQARPSLLARARNADLLACTGGELEAGWLPILLRQSGNANIQPGKAGYFEAANYVQKLEIPARLDRAEGDVHASGNPHIHTDPRNIALVADALAKRLSQLDPDNAAHYQARHRAFADQWQAAVLRWEKQAAPLKGTPVVVQHKAFPYLSRWLGLQEIAVLEPKPGIESSSGHLSEVFAQITRQPVKMVLRAAYQDGRSSEWLAEKARIHAVSLPFTVGGSAQAQDLYGLFDDTIQRLLAAAK